MARVRRTYVTDGVVGNVDAVLEQTLSTRLAGCGNLGGVDDLVGGGLDNVLGVEVEDFLVLLPLVILLVPLVVEILLAVADFLVGVLVELNSRSGDGKSRSQESDESRCGEVHLECVVYVVVIVGGEGCSG